MTNNEVKTDINKVNKHRQAESKEWLAEQNKFLRSEEFLTFFNRIRQDQQDRRLDHDL